MAFNGNRNKNTRQTDTGGGGNQSRPRFASLREVEERQKRLKERMEALRIKKLMEERETDDLAVDRARVEKYYNTQERFGVQRPDAGGVPPINFTDTGAVNPSSIMSRWATGGASGTSIDQAVEMTGGQWYMPGRFRTKAEYDAFRKWDIDETARETETNRLRGVTSVKDYAGITNRTEQLAAQLRDEPDAARRATIQSELDWTRKYAADNFAGGARSSVVEMDSKAAAQQRTLDILKRRMSNIDEEYIRAQRGIELDPASVESTNANFDASLEGVTDPFVRQKILEARGQYAEDPANYSGAEMSTAEQGLTLNDVERRRKDLQKDIDETQGALHGLTGTAGKTQRYYLEMNAQRGYSDMPRREDFAANSRPVSGNEIMLDVRSLAPSENGLQQTVDSFPISQLAEGKYMTPQELAVAYYIRNTQGNTAAAQYVEDFLGQTIKQRQMQAEAQAMQKQGQTDGALDGTLNTIGAAIGQRYAGAMGAMDIGTDRLANFLSEYGLADFRPVSTYNDFSNAAAGATEYTAAMSQRIEESAGSVASFFYDTGVSMIGSASTMPGGAIIGGALSGLSAGDSAYREAIEAGLDEDAAFATAGAAAIFEQAFETLSLEKLFSLGSPKSITGALKNMFKQGVFEASEEVATSLANTVYDNLVNGGMSQLNRRIADLEADGMDYNEARDQANSEWIKQLALDGVGGFVSGGVFAAGNQVGQYVGNRNEQRMMDAVNSDTTNAMLDDMPPAGLGAPSRTSDAQGGKPTPGTPSAAKLAADERREKFNVSDANDTYVTNELGERNIVTPLNIKDAGTENATVAVKDDAGNVTYTPINDVEFRGGDADVYAYAANMPNDELANAFITNVDENTENKEDVFAGMQFAFERAMEGRRFDRVQASILAQGLSEGQLRAAFDLGANNRNAQIAKEQAAAMAKRKSAPVTAGIVDYGTVNVESLSDVQKQHISITDNFAKAMGLTVKLFESNVNADGIFTNETGEVAPNGFIDTKTGVISIDVNAGRNNSTDDIVETAIVATLSHEMTHAGQMLSPALYYEYRDMVIGFIEDSGESVDSMIERQMATDRGVKSREDALDEIVANASSRMLLDSDYVTRLFEARPQQAKTIGQKVVDFLHGLKEKIRAAFSGNTRVRKEYALIESKIDQLIKPWSDMMADATRLNESATVGEKVTTKAREAVKAPKPAGTVGMYDEPAMPDERHIDRRTWSDAEDASLTAFVNDYKMARYYMAPAANALLADLDSTVKAQGAMPVDDYAREWIAGERITTDKVAYLLDGGVSYAELNRILGKLAAAQGDADVKFNDSKALKRIELVLNDMLSNGYETSFGTKLAPDRGYLEYKASLPGADSIAIPDNAVDGSFAEYADAGVRNSAREADDYSQKFVTLRGERDGLRQAVDSALKSDEFQRAVDALSVNLASGSDAEREAIKAYRRASEPIAKMQARLNQIEAEMAKLDEQAAGTREDQESAKIAKSGKSPEEYYRAKAVKEFGITTNFNYAGYILPNGKMLNFGGQGNVRGQDHRAIGTIYPNGGHTEALIRFMNEGSVRIMAESPGVDVSTSNEPTRAQYATIRSFVESHGGKEFYVDLSGKDGKSAGSYEYEGRVSPSRVVADIQYFFENGERRPQSDVSRFRYSARDSAYLSAVESGDMDAAQKMVDEAAEKAGYTIKAYHGTPRDFTVFSKERIGSETDYGWFGKGFYFTTKPDVAKVYSGYLPRSRVIEAYLKVQNPFDFGEYEGTAGEIIEKVTGKKYGDWSGTTEEQKAQRSADFSGWLAENGYDGAKVWSQIMILDSSQAKQTDPVTYTSSGSVIPLSERFNPANEDIRYSARDSGEVDSDGNTLSVGQSEFFENSNVRDRNDNLLVLYHGTPNEFTVFDPKLTRNIGVHFGTLEQAKYFSNGKLPPAYYLNAHVNEYAIDHVFSNREYSIRDILDALVGEDMLTRDDKEAIVNATSARDFETFKKVNKADDLREIEESDLMEYWQDAAKRLWARIGVRLRKNGFTGIKYNNGFEGSGHSYVVFSPNQAKLVSNQSPTRDNDIRYSARDPEDISSREVLATALEGAAQNERERKMLKAYKEQIGKYDGIQKDIAAKRARIKELTFGKYERTGETRDELAKLKNQVSVLWDQLSRQDKRLLDLEAMEPLKAVGEREKAAAVGKVRAQMNERIKAIREQRDEKVEATKQAARDRIDRMRQGRKDTEIRGKIKDIIDDLNKRLLKPVEGRYVPKQFTEMVVELGEMIQTRKYEPTSAKASEKLAAISKAYEKLKADPNFGSVYNEGVKEIIDHVTGLVEGKTIYQLDSRDLGELYVVLKAARKMIVDAVKVFGDEKNRDAIKLGVMGIEELRGSRGSMKWDEAEKFLSSLLATRSMFLRFGNQEEGGAWDTAYKILNNGGHRVDRILMESNAIYKGVVEGKENRKELAKLQSTKKADLVDVGLKDDDGNAVMITRGMMLELYEGLRNPQNIAHIMYGGMTTPDLQKFYDDDPNAWGKKNVRIAGFGVQFTALEERLEAAKTDSERAAIQDEYNNVKAQGDAYISTMRETIEKQFTAYEKRFIAASDYYYNKYSKDTLNEVTNELYGYERATVDGNYFPIRTNKNFRTAEFTTIKRDFSIANTGMMKNRVNASNPILLGDIVETTRIHMQQMAQYAGLVIPLSDFSKIYSTTLPAYSDSLQNALVSAFDVTATKWVENYISDINHARKREHTVFDSLKGKYAKSILTANVVSAMKQVTAYPTAASVVGWTPTLKALVRGGRSNMPFSRSDRALIDKYSTVLYSAARGLTSAELGDVRDNMKWGDRFNKAIDFLQKLDVATRGRMWDAARYYVDANFNGLAKGTQEQIDAGESPYYKKVAEVFDKVVEDTQQSYSASQLPDILRSPNALIRSMTMFMTQPLKNLGVIYDATANLRVKARAMRLDNNEQTRAEFKRAAGRFANSITAQAVAMVFEKIMSLAGMLLLYKAKSLFGDDDELTWDDILRWFAWDSFDSILGSLAFGRELASAIQSFVERKKPYDIEVMGVSSVTGVMISLYNGTREIERIFGDDYEAPKNFTDAVNEFGNGALAKLASSIGNLTGMPIGNVLNILKAGYLHGVDAMNGEFGSFEAGLERSATQNYQRLIESVLSGDTATAARARADLVRSGKDDEAIEQGVRNNAIKPLLLDGTIDEAKARELLVSYGGKTSGDAYWQVKEWLGKADSVDGEYNKYMTLREAVISGKGVDAARKELTDNGVDETEVMKQMRSAVREAYVNGDMGASAAQSALTKYGLAEDANDAFWKLKEWDFKEINGIDASFSRFNAFLIAAPKGGTSMTSAAKELLAHGYEKSTVAREIAGKYKNQYLSLKESNPTQAAIMIEWLLNAYDAIGYDRDYQRKYINKNWKKDE